MDAEYVSLALVVIMAAASIHHLIPSPCRCEKCGYHVNERRMAKVRQAELSHDAEHKGFGWKDSTPDTWDCKDAHCARNKTTPPK